ncbi:MAG TPA: septum formation protein Maf, partial [candidate division WOR-3 bacterium]|nr:septum formation protein Maf [candidate division WOR-3 bacterium]
PAALAIRHARHKALSVLRPGLSGLVIGVDTIVVLGRSVLGKPAERDEARRMLLRLSGRSHRVISGLAVHDTGTGRTRTASEESRVTFRPLTRDEIERYLDTGEPFDKAGAYGIQGRAGAFVSRLEGGYPNVVGLPLSRLMAMLFACRDER